MNAERILVRANIRLLPTSESGRTTPIRGSYRPNHNFLGPDNRNMTIGFIDLPKGTELHPGDSIDLPIMFWDWAGLRGPDLPRPEVAHPGRCQARRGGNYHRDPSRRLVPDVWLWP
jgi:hypothetical protein